MVLSDLRIGQCARIVRVKGSGELRRRLLDMGLTPNTVVKLVRVAPLGDPIELCLRGYNLSLREEAARDIEVEMLSLDNGTCAKSCIHRGPCDCSNRASSSDSSTAEPSYVQFLQGRDRRCSCHEEINTPSPTERDASKDNHFTKVRKRRRWHRNR